MFDQDLAQLFGGLGFTHRVSMVESRQNLV
jgi:hypothetical protein